MDDSPEAFAVPIPYQIAGREWQISPLTNRDIGRFLQWCRECVVDLGRKQISSANGMDQDTKVLILDRAYKQAAQISFDEHNSFIQDTEGLIRLIYMSWRKEHPDITLDGVDAAIGLVKNIEAIALVVFKISGFDTSAATNVANRATEKPRKKKVKTPSPSTGRGLSGHSRKRTAGRLPS